MSYAQEIHVQANGPRNAERQLTKESVSGVNVGALAVLRHQQAVLLRLLPRTLRSQQRRVVRVPLIHEVQSTLLYPAIEIVFGYLVGIVEDRALWIEYLDGRLLDGNAVAT